MTFFSAPQCDDPTVLGAKTVEVRATVDVNYVFAPVFGLTSGEVGAGAVAIWAPVAQANPIPITVDQAQLTACSIPIQVPAPGSSVPCDIVYPKDTLEEPRWGVLDLAQWNDQDAAPCHVDAATLKDLIDSGGWPTPLPLNGDPPGTVPTYDCLDNGLEFSVWASMEGQVLTFPVIDIPGSTGETKPGGMPCNGDQADCQVDTANVVSFITLLVTSVVNNASTVEVHAEWLGPDTSSGGTIGGGVDFGIRTIRLVK
jgi:hypothetical protein